MGRHADDAGTHLELRRTAQLAGLLGGISWVLASVVPGAAAGLLLPVGAVLLTLALLGLGLMLVRSSVAPLRIFVALALPTLVWGVFGVVHGSAGDPALVDAAFGAIVGLVSALRLSHRGGPARRATL